MLGNEAAGHVAEDGLDAVVLVDLVESVERVACEFEILARLGHALHWSLARALQLAQLVASG